MKMICESLILENFKGIRNREIKLSDLTKICGENGVGKTTVVTAWLWLWCDKDYELNSNPEIRNDKAEDGDIASVTANCVIDGKKVSVKKYQKFKRSKPDAEGITKTSTTNGYEINSVEYSARDFEKKMTEEYGVDFSKMLQLTHVNAFISGMKDKKSRDEMRNTLFGMTENNSDVDIAKGEPKLKDVAKLLENYKVDEIEAMQKSSIRKINEEYGKDGEIIDAEIRGISAIKSDIDVSALESKKAELTGRITEVEKQIAAGAVDTSDIQNEIYSKNRQIEQIKDKLIDEYRDKKSEIDAEIEDEIDKKEKVSRKIAEIEDGIENKSAKAIDNERILESTKDEYIKVKEMVFDESEGVCAYCGQTLPTEQITELKKRFEDKRQADLKSINQKGKKIKKENEDLGKDIQTLKNELAEHKETLSNCEKNIKERLEAYDSLEEPDIENDKQILALNKEIEELNQKMLDMKSKATDTSALEDEKSGLQNQLEDVLKEIGKANTNDDADARIDELNKKKRELAQQKANAEKILYQLSILSMKKNEMLEEQVNQNFKIVKWKLFDVQKNGKTLDACIPFIDGYRFGQSTNTGREFLAKLDIINGLQNYYGQYYPAFVDGFESISKVTEDRISMDCQAIFLKVTEDKELEVR